MASFNEVNADAYCNVGINVGAAVRNVSRDGTSVYFEYNPYFYMNTDYWTQNSVCLWVEGAQYWNFYSESGKYHTNKGTVYYSDWVGKTITLSTSSSSTTVSVGVNGRWWNPTEYGPAGYVTLTLSGIPTISAPSLSNISTSSVTDSSVYASFTVTANNGQAPYDPYIDIFRNSNCTGLAASRQGRSGTLSGLDANRTYYARGNDANAAGRSYTNVASFTTSFYNPGNPGKPNLLYNTTELIPSATLTASWSAASAGSTSIGGYRIRIYKNGVQLGNAVDTDSTSTTYSFGKLEDLGFVPGDTVYVGIFAYCYDWAGNKHWSGNGTSQVVSNTLTVVSDKYIYVSSNGGSFTKYKMYMSQNGGSFTEIKKEKFKVIT